MTPSSEESKTDEVPRRFLTVMLWLSVLWVLPLIYVSYRFLGTSHIEGPLMLVVCTLAAPIPALLFAHRERARLIDRADRAAELAEQLRLQLETVRYRTARLRDELQVADRQARLSHQLTLLGQFTAGFMHEFNNPLAIVTGRIEVLLEERKDDDALCADLERMLKETRYMGKIAGTLLQALRRERTSEVFEPASPKEALREAVSAYKHMAEDQGVSLIEEMADVPRVDVPEHVIGEVVRGLLSNAMQALKGTEDGGIWIKIEPYRAGASRVVARIEDNGPGVPEGLREHLFEPFISQSSGRERLGLGLFLAASLLDIYDGRIRYEMRYGGGSSFVIEFPPTRFTRSQPYHWFAGGNLP
jgi:signal transduction histidine kinase